MQESPIEKVDGTSPEEPTILPHPPEVADAELKESSCKSFLNIVFFPITFVVAVILFIIELFIFFICIFPLFLLSGIYICLYLYF